MDIFFLISQISIVLSYAIFTCTYFIQGKIKILIINSISLLLEGLAYILLFAWSGLVMVLVACIRNLLFYSHEKIVNIHKEYKEYNWVSLMIVYALAIAGACITFENIYSLLPILASILYTYSLWQQNTIVYKLFGIFSSLLVILYNLYIHSIFGALCETIILGMIIVSFFFKSKHVVRKY